jgi:hypothetical protein
MATTKAETAIREYLNGLGKTNKRTVDREAVKNLKGQIRAEADPIAKLKLYGALEHAEHGTEIDLSGLEAVFIAEAKAWADANNVPGSAFQALKVDDEVLRRAGFALSALRKPSARRSAGTRKPPVPQGDVLKAIGSLGKTWTVNDLAAKLGRDATTARNYVNQLLKDNAVTTAGEVPKKAGDRGRAAKLYAKA